MPHDEDRWSPYRPPGRLVSPVAVDPSGRRGPTRGQSRGPRWRRVAPGRYVPASTDSSRPEQRIVEASSRLTGVRAITGWAALYLWGARFLDGVEPDGRTPQAVTLVLPPGCSRRRVPGVHVVHGVPGTVYLVAGVPVVGVRRATFDAMRLSASTREAVVALDMVAAAELTSVRRMTRYVEQRSWRGVPGVPQVRAALTLADDASASPPETRYRLVWQLDAALPRPLVNRPVFDRRTGRLLGYPDLLDPVAGLVGEYDGEDHRRARRHSSDVGREALLRAHDLEVTRATSLDLLDRAGLAARICEARGRARHRSAESRSWTLDPPPG